MEELFERVVAILTDYFHVKPRFDEDETDEWSIFQIGDRVVRANFCHVNDQTGLQITHGSDLGTRNDLFELEILEVLRRLDTKQSEQIKVTARTREHKILDT